MILRYIKYIKFFFKIKFIFKLPPKKNIVIFDTIHLNILLEILGKKNVEIISHRDNSINFFIFIKSIFCFRRLNLYQKYILNYVFFTKPKFIITCNDNNIFFCQIKKLLEKYFNYKVKTIIVQNAIRGGVGDFFYDVKNLSFEERKKMYVDHIFAQNRIIGKKFSDYLHGKYYPIGFIKNNVYSLNEIINIFPQNYQINKSLIFISSIDPYKIDENDNLFTTNIGKKINWISFYKTDIKIFNYLEKICVDNKIQLYVLERNMNSKKEKDIFIKYSKFKNFYFLKKLTHEFNSYKLINSFDNFIFIDSTLGYEAISRGKKAFAFSIRGYNLKKFYSDETLNFAWPNKAYVNKNGFYWCNNSYKKFSSNIKVLLNMPKALWLNKTKEFRNNVLKLDYNNKIFKNQLKKILSCA
jgi:surface carbohydrate biosynthesis protein